MVEVTGCYLTFYLVYLELNNYFVPFGLAFSLSEVLILNKFMVLLLANKSLQVCRVFMEKLNARSSEKVEMHKLIPTYLRNYCLKNSLLLLVSFNILTSLSSPAVHIQLIIKCIDDEFLNLPLECKSIPKVSCQSMY